MFAQNIKEQIDLYEHHENEREGLNGLIATWKSLHADERKISLLSIRLVYCTHELSKGYPCGSRMMLELDHIVPVARGGLNNLENLTLKCRHHNHWSAVQVYGQEHMDQFRN